jgi:RNA polymerase sigma-70 factor (ECF subfamily)
VIFDRYSDRVFAFIRVRTSDVHEAEDLTADVFLKAFRSMASYEERGAPFSAWLFRIARNTLTDTYRRAERMPIVVEEEEAERSLPPVEIEAEVLRRLRADDVREALHRLTDEQASVLALRFFADLGTKDTAAVLGKTEGAVKALQHRAMRALAKVLDEETERE